MGHDIVGSYIDDGEEHGEIVSLECLGDEVYNFVASGGSKAFKVLVFTCG